MNGKKVKVQDFEPDSASRRRTLNSLSSTPSLGLLASVPPSVPIDSHTGLPASPSRSPSPPVAAPGQKYTDDDAVFFFKRIAYDLSRNPEHNKASLCDMLAKKAPHHSALSWKTYWIRHEDVADKMLLLTQLDDQDREEVIRSWKTGISVTANGTGNQSRKQAKKVNYQENSESGSGSDSESDGSESAYSEEVSNDEDEDGDDAVGSTDDDEELGVAGSPFTTAECRVLAKHIAIVPDWFRGYKEWDDFTSTYTQRTPASWKEFYRRRSKDVDALAKKYIKRAKKQQTVAAQRGRPSWARRGSSKPSMSSVGDSGSTKRRYSSSEERERSEEKRAKMNELDIY
ncbi:hypothetical protein DFH11DRAFT_1499951 [Phellopilus nigrolimitatus]|nr:hypothetical protein DFH11DRAFT_1499951 [Phellopilus nigrolimitatus]